MDLVKPGFGLIVWATLTFSLVLFILGKFAWKPILKALRDREQKIRDSLDLAEKTKLEMQAIQAQNEELIQQARMERELILKEAKEMKEDIISAARKSAEEENKRVLAQARETIEREKALALTELKNMAANISVEIAEKILRKKLDNKQEQETLISDYLNNLNIN